jgi:hypothetical protein
MRSPSPLRFLLLAPVVALLLAGSMAAPSFGQSIPIIITQKAFVQHFGIGQSVTDRTDDAGTGVITRDVLAEISSPPRDPNFQFSAAASVGRFGAVGLMVFESSNLNHTTDAEVQISNSEFVNLTPNPQHAMSRVVIDGGMMTSVFTRPGTGIDYNYELYSTIIDPVGTFTQHFFSSQGQLITGIFSPGLSFSVSSNSMATFVDLGATFLPTAFDTSGNPISGTVTIPLSFLTFDLGVIPPGGRLALGYLFKFEAGTGGAAGGFESELLGQFGDPFHLSTNAALGTITFEPVSSEPPGVPEPAGAILIASGGLILLVHAWRRRGRKRPGSCLSTSLSTAG